MRRPDVMHLSMRLLRQLGLALLPAILLLASAPARPQGRGGEVAQHQVKAAYLLKFASFVDWPADAFAAAHSPLTIGVAGADDVADELERAAQGQVINGRRLAVQRLHEGDPAANVQIVFIGALDKHKLKDWLASFRAHPVLTVTDSAEAGAQGSMIHFLVVDGRQRFEVALQPVAASRLKIRAFMLAAAYKVLKEES